MLFSIATIAAAFLATATALPAVESRAAEVNPFVELKEPSSLACDWAGYEQCTKICKGMCTVPNPGCGLQSGLCYAYCASSAGC